MPLKDPDARRAYQREYARKWYRQNRAKHVGRVSQSRKARLAERRRQLNAIKSRPCMDCGQSFPPVCMDFDHVTGDKVNHVSRMLDRSWDEILAEIAKCEIVCANCHRLRTEARRLAR